MAKKTNVKPAPSTAAVPARPAAAPARGGSPAVRVDDDPALAVFGEALAVLGRKEWEAAIRLFEKVLAESDRADLSARARQYRAIAEKQRAGSTPKAGSKAGDEDPFLTALVTKNRGDFAAALEICRHGGRDEKDERFAYLVAAILGLEGRLEEAAQALTRAVELNPKNRIHAFHDADFAELRKNRDYRSVFGLP